MPIILSAPAKRKNTRRKAPAMRMNGEFYAQPYEQYVQYMYSVGRQPMVAWEWAEKQQAYYDKKAAKRPMTEAQRAAKEAAREAERVAKAAEKEADKARRAAERAAARAAAKVAERTARAAARAAERAAWEAGRPARLAALAAERAARRSRAEAHATVRAGGLPMGLRDALEQTPTPANGVTLVVTPEGAVAQGSYKVMSEGRSGGAISVLKAHGFTWLPQERVWAFLGFFDMDHFRALADDLASRGVDVRRVGFNPRRKNTRRKVALPPMRNNGSRSTVDPVAARELELYIENEANLVGPGNSLGANIMRMLAGRIVRGTYDSTKAWKAWVPLTTEGAKRYKREIGPINASKATRDAVATRLSEAFESEVRSGGIDPMKLLGKR